MFMFFLYLICFHVNILHNVFSVIFIDFFFAPELLFVLSSRKIYCKS
jgi:hypothetical protein